MINKKLAKLLAPDKKYLFLNLFFRYISLVMQIGIFFLISKSVMKIFEGGAIPIGKYFSLALIFVGARIYSQYQVSNIAFLSTMTMKEKMRTLIFDKLMDDRIDYKKSLSTSSILQLAVEGVDQLEIYFTSYMPQLYYSLSSALILFALISLVSLKASLVLLVCLPLIPISIILVQKIAKKLLGNYWTSYTSLADIFLENLEGLTDLKVYGADSYRQDVMDDFSEKFRKATMRVLMMQLNSTSVMDIIAYAGAGLGIGVSLLEFSRGNITMFGLIFISLLASEFFLPLRLLGSFFHIAMNGIAASNKLMGLLESDSLNLSSDKIVGGKIDVSFKDVGFSYKKDRKILDSINISIKSGEFVSLVGLSGSGKSTIARLLTDYSLKYDGKIIINDKEKMTLDPKDLHKKIIRVDFDQKLFRGSLRDNLLVANPSLSDDILLDVLKKVNLYDFFDQEDGLDTQILENSSNLSGGQRQRLNLARAFLSDGLLYIFDEATSNIDRVNEEKIMTLIKNLAKEKAVLLISHKLINLIDSSRIYFIENGKISASGSHEEIYRRSKAYRQIFDKQEELVNYLKGVDYEN